MSLNTLTSTLPPTTPESSLRKGGLLLLGSSPQSMHNPATPSKSPNGGFVSSLDPANAHIERSVTPANDSVNGDGEWSSAVGRASVAGKSGRVIERLMGDVDRLKRELNLAQARVEEEQLRSTSAREALDSLRGTKENLEAICETNRNVISRRDRKIEELKADLDSERSQRDEAEKGRNNLSVEMLALRKDCEKEVARASEVAARATAEYETFRKSLQRMKVDWEKQASQMRKEMDVVQNDRDSERTRVQKLGTVCEQLRAEQYKMTGSFDKITKEYSAYKRQMDTTVREMVERLIAGDTANTDLHTDLRKTLEEMKWVINVRKNVPSLYQDSVEPGASE